MDNHELLDYHKAAVARKLAFDEQRKNVSRRVDHQLLSQSETEFNQNKAALTSLVQCVIYCGKQGIPFRGHRDDSTTDPQSNRGNFQALVEFRAQTDANLARFKATCPGNARYTSKTIQNDIIDVIGEFIRDKITQNINSNSPFYSIIGDEVTDDIANQQIFSLCIRYIDYGINNSLSPKIRENFIDFCHVDRGTADAIVKAILTCLNRSKLQKEYVRGQAYDTTSSMSSEANGVQAKFRTLVPAAIYSPCNSHKLNLAIASASKLVPIRNCITAVNEIFLFFDNSPKRQKFLEKVIAIKNI